MDWPLEQGHQTAQQTEYRLKEIKCMHDGVVGWLLAPLSVLLLEPIHPKPLRGTNEPRRILLLAAEISRVHSPEKRVRQTGSELRGLQMVSLGLSQMRALERRKGWSLLVPLRKGQKVLPLG